MSNGACDERSGTSDGYWPLGGKLVPYGQLSLNLAGSAKLHARRAIELFASSDPFECQVAAASVGSAVELMAKAYLASVQPSLLADKGDVDSLLIMGGNAHLTKVKPSYVKTRSASDVMTIVKKLQPTMVWRDQIDRGVLNVRNSALHFGMVDVDDLSAALPVMVRVIDHLQPLVQPSQTRRMFWGEHAFDVANRLVDAAVNDLAKRIESKIARARAHLESLTAGLPESTSTQFLRSIALRVNGIYKLSVEKPCPVCGFPGWLGGEVTRGAVVWGDGDVPTHLERIFLPMAFSCSVCNLRLNPDELEYFGLDDDEELEPEVDPPEADTWEPSDTDFEEMHFRAKYGDELDESPDY